jgi:flagellar export protein FliJ
MAKGLHTLIRIHEWDVDEKRRFLARLLNHINALERQGRNLETEIKREQGVAAASQEVIFAYGAYAEAAICRRENIADNIVRAEIEIVAAQDVLTEAYRELKTYEIAQENRQHEEKLEFGRKEQAELNEIGIRGARPLNKGLLGGDMP